MRENYGEFQDGLKMNYYELEPENNTFNTLLVDVTHKCNMECLNCYIPNRSIPDMDVNLLYNFLKKLPNRTDIRLIGAEATVRNDLFDIIKNVRDIGHHPALLTNGLRLASSKYVRNLKKSGLRSLGLSMNGADNDDWYYKLDNGPYSKSKVKALINCFNEKLVVHTNTIIVKNINESVIKQQINLLVETAKKTKRTFKKTYPIMARFKSVGKIGRYIDTESYSLDDLANLFSNQMNVDKNKILLYNNIEGHIECNSLLFSYETEVGPLLIKMTDWSVDDDGIPDSGSKRRGRVTQDFKCAPFFEHVKLNEFGY